MPDSTSPSPRGYGRLRGHSLVTPLDMFGKEHALLTGKTRLNTAALPRHRGPPTNEHFVSRRHQMIK